MNALHRALIAAALFAGFLAGCHDAPDPGTDRTRGARSMATASSQGLHSTFALGTDQPADEGPPLYGTGVSFGAGLRPSRSASGISP